MESSALGGLPGLLFYGSGDESREPFAMAPRSGRRRRFSGSLFWTVRPREPADNISRWRDGAARASVPTHQWRGLHVLYFCGGHAAVLRGDADGCRRRIGHDWSDRRHPTDLATRQWLGAFLFRDLSGNQDRKSVV